MNNHPCTGECSEFKNGEQCFFCLIDEIVVSMNRGKSSMNAINFIKEHGIDKAREVVEGAPERATTVKPSLDFKHFMYGICEEAGGAYILLSDLKRLVESVDLVNCNGGWNGTKNTITLFQSSLDLGLYHGVDGVDAEVEILRLKQAIADYESIGGEHV